MGFYYVLSFLKKPPPNRDGWVGIDYLNLMMKNS